MTECQVDLKPLIEHGAKFDCLEFAAPILQDGSMDQAFEFGMG
jgi:hypothetical protein